MFKKKFHERFFAHINLQENNADKVDENGKMNIDHEDNGIN